MNIFYKGARYIKRAIKRTDYKELKELFSSEIAKKDKQIEELNQRIIILENTKPILSSTELLENKVNQLNWATNQMLYEMKLETAKKVMKDAEKFNPLVSIIIPVYNGSNYLKEAIDSALAQTYKNIEILVINDGSTDDGVTEKIAKSYKNKIRYYKKENGGVSSALNYGIKKMNGEYFAWLSHDDLFAKNNIEEHVRYLKYSLDKNIVTYTGFNLVDGEGRLIYNQSQWAKLYLFDYKLSLIDPKTSLLQGEINGSSVMISKKVFEECGFFDEADRVSQERDMWIRILKKHIFVSIPYITTSIRIHPKQVSNQRDDILEKSNAKRYEILKIVEERIKSIQDKKAFYLEMENYYRLNGLTFLEEKSQELLNDLDK